VGGGISGLTFALKAVAFAKVYLIAKDGLYISNSYQAKGGIAAVFADNDSVDAHIQDTLVAGEGLCNNHAVNFMIRNAKESIIELLRLGVDFTQDHHRNLDLSKEGGHRHNRIVHAKDETGKHVIETLVKLVREHPNIYIYENHFAIDLIIENGECCGATILDQDKNEIYKLFADKTILATGGAAQVYALNTNPNSASGDGFAMAYRVGAEISNMEFVQFHPTMLYLKNQEENILISEALRGAGAELKNLDGSIFMNKYHPMGSLAPRDIVTRSMIKEMQKCHSDFLYLDATHIENGLLETEFPYIYNICKKYGIDISKRMIPVAPAAHYICGGVNTDLTGRTSVPNLFAIGEVACTGVHGANRLASNSLLEGLVFANAAAMYIQYSPIGIHEYYKHIITHVTEEKPPKSSISVDLKKIQSLMWANVGIVRNEEALNKAKYTLKKWEGELLDINPKNTLSRDNCELLNMVQTSLLITEAAIVRKESIGTHYRDDSIHNIQKNIFQGNINSKEEFTL